MNHMKSFAAIPMSKCMRDMCKEEDYAFLNNQKSREIDKTPKESTFREREWQQKQEEREKEEQWKSHVAGLASERESLRGRLHRLREFRDFQKRVLMQDLGLEPGTASENLTQLLMRL
ncbi:U2 small nuclear ribonucleoprotein auxiliary factor 35 kDa subunit-related protein 1-like isoform X2 [Ictalurus punctatus]|uniref:U2 small nuclear ribonucleoprotein auxiliary factor 35 kDa subunit-related protein 1-like isoform X2 n=1 Tax=Ictalurus punctatus TaxID=7998 RepID=A0A9F7RW25_ICTPU|nr:U2 small nuclear ribonucleoprotein auxiliary factor 35 kDa subunit-related protein 1-like isoform X2 [Ictalurus punctatus]